MEKWELAFYVIEAKQNIDALLYIEQNEDKLKNIGLHDCIKNEVQQFYISCVVVIDNCFDRHKKAEIRKNHRIIERICYERNKFAAHKDENYEMQDFNTPIELINLMKEQLEELCRVCKDFLPSEITLDYVPHDKELFRIVHRINADFERDINMMKYPTGKFHSYQLSEDGKFYFRNRDTEQQDRMTAKMFGYDYDNVMENYNSEEVQRALENPQRDRMIYLNGINYYESIQNVQKECIKLNITYNKNLWMKLDKKRIQEIERLKEAGVLDEFEIMNASSV